MYSRRDANASRAKNDALNISTSGGYAPRYRTRVASGLRLTDASKIRGDLPARNVSRKRTRISKVSQHLSHSRAKRTSHIRRPLTHRKKCSTLAKHRRGRIHFSTTKTGFKRGRT